jgi:hypothetical protein
MTTILKSYLGTITGIAVLAATPLALAAGSAMPATAEKKSPELNAAQSTVDKQSSDTTAEKRKKILEDAKAAIAETEKALKDLEEKKKDDALQSLALATGKLELILARAPTLALAPIEVAVVTHDLLAKQDTIKALTEEAKEKMNNGEIQGARKLLAGLASEIEYRTTSIPLATYPAAIKAITPLIDAGKIEEAKAGLRTALRTLVVTTEAVPLPRLRAEYLVKEAQRLAEKKDRSTNENSKLKKDLEEARNQLKLAELLGYGKKDAYQAIYQQIDELEKKTSGGKSGKGWFDKIKASLKNLF